MEFIGRKHELETLNREYGRKCSFVVVYGRRRIGKTTLLQEFAKDKDSIYFMADQEHGSGNLRNFSDSVCKKINMPGASFNSWTDALDALTRESKRIIIIDEFQYLVQSDPSVPSAFQVAWDTVLKNREVMLILCGSYIGLMEKHTLNYSSPLYGRRTASIKLGKLELDEIEGSFPDMTGRQLIEYYAVTGGVPKYMEIFGEDSLRENIKHHVFNRNGFLYEEPLFLLANEVKDPVNYLSILRSIAAGNRKLSDIAGNMEVRSNVLSPYLNTLIELDIVERRVPVTENNPGGGRNGMYCIKDNFISFWFAFVYPYRRFLESGTDADALRNFDSRFIDWHVSFVFEEICRARLRTRALVGGTYTKIGSYWEKGIEIDVVAVDPVNKKIFAAECKYTSKRISASVLESLVDKCTRARGFTGYDVTYGIFSAGGFDDGLKKMAAERGVLLVDMS